jgi:adenylosuccinate synthase
MSIFKTNEVLKKMVRKDITQDRKILQIEGERLDKKTQGSWVLRALMERSSEYLSASDCIVDSVRIVEQIRTIREAFGVRVIHVHLTAPLKELELRFNNRRKHGRDTGFQYSEIISDPTENQIEKLAEIADVVINTKRSTEQDVLIRTMSFLNIRGGKGSGFVDVIVGGQYGSEGKGQIVAHIAKEYQMLIRVGGPNAGHSVFEVPEPYAHHQLPSGTRNSEARLVIGPGAVLRVDKLLKEIADCGVDSQRLRIDGNAMVISDADIAAEDELKKNIGSTGQGVGAATSRRIMGRSNKNTLLAKNIPELKPFIGDTLALLENAYSKNEKVLLEGTQGTGLSLYHGYYPYVTSRDTTASGCLAEAGISPNRVRKVIMVCRTYPIRVQSPEDETSGPLRDISWEEIARRSGLKADKLRAAEKTTTTKRQRRIGEFDWDILHRAALLNGATDIALTFTDYIRKENGEAKRFEQLTKETINFIQEVERVSGAPVSIISTGFNSRSIIDRRSW